MDGKFDDWVIVNNGYIDNTHDGTGIDFHSFYVTNDENFLYIKFKLTPEIKLQEITSEAPTLYIDGDNKSNTGIQVNGIGAELKWNFGTRNGSFVKSSTTTIRYDKIQLRYLPTVTSEEYELAIGRFVKPDNVNFLFTSDTIKIQFKNEKSNGDLMPNAGTTFSYVFDNTPLPPYEVININKSDSTFLRVMTYNVEFDGLMDVNKQPMYQRIFNAIKPDIITFNEFFNTTAEQVRTVMTQLYPLPCAAPWYAIKLDAGNVTLSRYPFKQHWAVYPGQRITASLIDLSLYYPSDLLLINCHLRCCTADDIRQREADAIIAFLRDAKTDGGIITLPPKTPFMIAGDLNLVGYSQQLRTLLNGEIVNTSTYGTSGPPDWDSTSLEDLYSYHTDKPTAYTWRDDSQSYSPGRLDFMIYSNSVMKVEKSFVLQTEVMPLDRLSMYELKQTDTKSASDHFPKIADFSFITTTGFTEKPEVNGFALLQNYPNPFNPKTSISYQLSTSGNVVLKLFDVLGNEVATLVNEHKPTGKYEVQFDGTNLTSGIYFYRIQSGSYIETKKMILMK
ncbi:MAG TPA: T9SS type A sorting domain-containing protein [Ignavibacteriaceae bacterium]|nr:T9SS type A sorting domain-containing protein [Ignavibacteriaceae bacterium]